MLSRFFQSTYMSWTSELSVSPLHAHRLCMNWNQARMAALGMFCHFAKHYKLFQTWVHAVEAVWVMMYHS